MFPAVIEDHRDITFPRNHEEGNALSILTRAADFSDKELFTFFVDNITLRFTSKALSYPFDDRYNCLLTFIMIEFIHK